MLLKKFTSFLVILTLLAFESTKAGQSDTRAMTAAQAVLYGGVNLESNTTGGDEANFTGTYNLDIPPNNSDNYLWKFKGVGARITDPSVKANYEYAVCKALFRKEPDFSSKLSDEYKSAYNKICKPVIAANAVINGGGLLNPSDRQKMAVGNNTYIHTDNSPAANPDNILWRLGGLQWYSNDIPNFGENFNDYMKALCVQLSASSYDMTKLSDKYKDLYNQVKSTCGNITFTKIDSVSAPAAKKTEEKTPETTVKPVPGMPAPEGKMTGEASTEGTITAPPAFEGTSTSVATETSTEVKPEVIAPEAPQTPETPKVAEVTPAITPVVTPAVTPAAPAKPAAPVKPAVTPAKPAPKKVALTAKQKADINKQIAELNKKIIKQPKNTNELIKQRTALQAKLKAG